MKNKSNKKVLAIDIDEVINNLISAILIKYNKKYNDNVELKDITSYDISRFLNKQCNNIFKEFVDNELFEILRPKENCISTLNELNKLYDVYYLTAGHPCTMKSRDEWLKRYLKGYKSKQLVMCVDKFRFNCDILIDDSFENLIKMPVSCIKIIYDRPWNCNENVENYNIIRINNWYDIYKLFVEY